jgi:hypothetical protein
MYFEPPSNASLAPACPGCLTPGKLPPRKNLHLASIPSTPTPFIPISRISTRKMRPIICPSNLFRMNTSITDRKQIGLSSFKMNTYAKHGGGCPIIVNQISDTDICPACPDPLRETAATHLTLRGVAHDTSNLAHLTFAFIQTNSPLKLIR